MGCPNSRSKYINELKTLSLNSLDERIIEEIIMKTYFDEKQLFFLYKRFLELRPNQIGLISNLQLLEMNEFKFCSFKKFLPKALKLIENANNIKQNKNFKENIIIINNNNNNHHHLLEKYLPENNLENNLINLKNLNNFKINEDDKNKYESVLTINAVENENENDNLNVDNFNKSTKFNKLILNDNKELENDVNIIEKDQKLKGIVNVDENAYDLLMEYPYIDFPRFCNILKVFNENYPVDLKIKFYYRLFDVDGDGKLSKRDLKSFLAEIFPDDVVFNTNEKIENQAVEKKEENSHSINFDKLIDIVFGEIVYSEKRTYIDFDEFSQVMWTTNIDKSCVINLED